MRRVVSLYLPTWPTDRLRRLQAAPPEGPLLLAAREGSQRLVAAVDAEAAALGLRAGMPVAQAQAMVPDLAVIEADPAADAAALARLAGWCLRYSPLTAPDAPDGVLLDITGCAHLTGGEAALLADLRRRLAAAGLAARASVADTPGAAHALARFGAAAESVVPPGGTAAALARLPVAALRLPAETADGLHRLGFERIGQLAKTPRAPLVRRFGAGLMRRLDQALGAVAEPIEPVLPPGLPRARQRFAEPILTAEDFLRAIELLAEGLCGKLARRGLGARQVDLLFQRVDGSAHLARIGTSAPSRDPAHLLRLLRPEIERVDPGFGVETMLLAAPLTEFLGAQQIIGELGGEVTVPELTGLVDALANRLGARRVFRMAPVESDLPERAQRRVAPLARIVADWPAQLPRPPRLFDPPRLVEVMALLPDHPPAQFVWRRRAHRIRRADGPERVFGEWWKSADETEVVRDYFQVEDEHGQRFWLFRNGDGGRSELRWFLHGIFG